MNVLIVEDEAPASDRLIKMLNGIKPDLTVAGVVVSVRSAIDWLSANPAPDLIIMDIQLADGISFDIFNEVKVTSPVIFTTAYNEYAVRAFKVYSIDYLLKPVKKAELEAAIRKYDVFFADKSEVDYGRLAEEIRTASIGGYQKRIVIRFRDLIKVIEIEDVAYFFTSGKVNFACTKENRQYPVDYTLDELEKILDPTRFFRVNRQLIVTIGSIDKMVAVSKSRVKISLKPPMDQEAVVSAERSPEFKKWLLGK